jgi:hypothetical protein
MLSVAASSEVSGGVRRVFTAQANGTLAINARAQRGLFGSGLGTGSMFIQQERTIRRDWQMAGVVEPQRKLTNIPLATAKIHIDAPTKAATVEETFPTTVNAVEL